MTEVRGERHCGKVTMVKVRGQRSAQKSIAKVDIPAKEGLLDDAQITTTTRHNNTNKLPAKGKNFQ